MNKLFLLLLGVLYTTGCVRAQITLEDAKQAIGVAWNFYQKADPSDPKFYNERIDLTDGRRVNVGCRFRGDFGTRFDCDLPSGNKMPEKDFNELKEWFEKTFPGYEMKTPEDKYGSRFANTGKEGGTTFSKDFNFHVEIEKTVQLLMKLLSRLLQ